MEINGNYSLGLKNNNISPYVSHILGHDKSCGWISPYYAYWLWEKSDAISDSVNRIVDATIQIIPVVKNKKTGEISTEHPALELLNNPRGFFSRNALIAELMTAYCITGYFCPVLVGNVNYAPTMVYPIRSNHVSLEEGVSGWLENIRFSEPYDQETYSLNKASGWVYQRRDNLAETKYIFKDRRRSGIYADNPINKIYYQASTKYYGNMHNSNILKKGTRPGGIYSPASDALSQEQYEQFREEVRGKIGPANAGRDIVAPTPVKYTDLMLNTRDMDFVELIDRAGKDVYTQFQIPLPLISPETMTLNNFGKAVEAFYDFSVLPRAGFFYGELGNFLLRRYQGGHELEFAIDEKQLTALKERMINRAKNMREAFAYSDNEIRQETGNESIGEEGNQIWKPSKWVQAGEDDYTEDNINRG